jgi:hypothetical protein
MKKIIIISLGLIGLVSCRSQYPTHFNFNRLEGDFNDISVRNDTFFYNSQPIAFFNNMGLECLEENCVVEISVNQFSDGFNDVTQMIMKYLHKQHPHSKIEIKVK